MGRKPTVILNEKQLSDIAEAFADGASVESVRKVFGISWSRAKELQPGGVEKKVPAHKPAKRTAKPDVPELEDAAEETDESEWDVPIRIPIDRADDIFSQFTVAEKMDAIRVVLRERMNIALAVEGEAAE